MADEELKRDRPLPWMQWFPNDYAADPRTHKLTLAEHGLARQLMDLSWGAGSVPASAEGIADLLGENPALIKGLLPAVAKLADVDSNDDTMTFRIIEKARTQQDKYRAEQSRRSQRRFQQGQTIIPGHPESSGDVRRHLEEKRTAEKRTTKNTPPIPPRGEEW